MNCFQIVIHTIRLPKQSTVGDVIADLKTKVLKLNLCFCKLYFIIYKIPVLHLKEKRLTLETVSDINMKFLMIYKLRHEFHTSLEFFCSLEYYLQYPND